MNQLDTDQFKQIISRFDSKYGEESKEYKDTILALSLIMMRGKELRNVVRKEKIKYRYKNECDIIESEFPRVLRVKIKFALFREGIFSYDYIDLFYWIIYWLALIIQIIVVIFIIPNTYGENGWFGTFGNLLVVKIMMIITSIIISHIFATSIEKWAETTGNSYFGLGHKR